MAAEGDVIITYIFTGEEQRDENGRHIIPQNVTRLIFHESIEVIPVRLFYKHPNIVEVYCHVGVKRIERLAFTQCPRLKRLIIPGVEVVEYQAFYYCEAVTYVECPKLEIVGEWAFNGFESLSSINLPSTKIVEGGGISNSYRLTDAKFGMNLQSVGREAFYNCPSLERITIPLKNGLFTSDDIFQACGNLRRADLVEGAVLQDTIDALLLEEWRNDMNAVVASINQILPNARAGTFRRNDVGGKAQVIRDWIERILRKIIVYKAQHRLLSNEAATALQLVLPNDIVMDNVLPFLDLPVHTFYGEGQEDERGGD